MLCCRFCAFAVFSFVISINGYICVCTLLSTLQTSLTHSLSLVSHSLLFSRQWEKNSECNEVAISISKNGIFYYTKIPMSIGIEKYCPLISAHYKRKRQPKRKADNKQSRHCQHELFIVGLLFSCYKVAMVDILKFFISISFCAFRICFVVTIYW